MIIHKSEIWILLFYLSGFSFSRKWREEYRRVLVLCYIAVLAFPLNVLAEEKEVSIAIVCPEMQEPYRTVFTEMIEGINKYAQNNVPLFVVNSKTDLNELQTKLKQSDAKVIVTLGRQGLKVLSGFSINTPIVVGGVLNIPEGFEGRSIVGLSVTPDPFPLFVRMKSLMPETKKIIVVYNPKHTGWLIKFAQEAAKINGLDLEAFAVNSTESAAQQYNQLMAKMDHGKAALWMPQDATSVDESVILPFILKEAWERSIPLFSSSVSHAQRGALFAMYPDNRQFGAALGELARRVVRGEHITPSFKPFRNAQSTLNMRMATHLGIILSPVQQKQFDTILSSDR